MKIDFKNESSIKTIDSKEHPKRSSGRTMTVYPLTLEMVKEKYCPNCTNWNGDNHDYKCKSCEKCMDIIKQSQTCFGQN